MLGDGKRRGRGGAALGVTLHYKQIRLLLSNVWLVLPYQSFGKEIQSLPLWPKVFFNMQKRRLCVAVHTDQFPAPSSAQNPKAYPRSRGEPPTSHDGASFDCNRLSKQWLFSFMLTKLPKFTLNVQQKASPSFLSLHKLELLHKSETEGVVIDPRI